jgi:hypothetical protein
MCWMIAGDDLTEDGESVWEAVKGASAGLTDVVGGPPTLAEAGQGGIHIV